MMQPSTRFVAGASGALLVLAGLALVLVVWLGGADDDGAAANASEGGSSVAAAASPAEPGPEGGGDGPDQGAEADSSDSASTPSFSIGPDGKPEPYWRAKQREAREEQVQVAPAGESGGGSVGAPGAGGSPAAEATPGTTVPRTRLVSSGGRTPLTGVWAGSAQDLASYLLSQNSSPAFTVPVAALADHYIRFAAEVGLRADVLWAQMLHETGFGAYGGSVSSAQNNFAGIGATGGGVAGYTFSTAEQGVKAHVAHMVAYVFVDDRAPWTSAAVDPRYNEVSPRGIARVLADLDGRWAVPGNGYGAAIERHVAAMNR